VVNLQRHHEPRFVALSPMRDQLGLTVGGGTGCRSTCSSVGSTAHPILEPAGALAKTRMRPSRVGMLDEVRG
jgi:hypothetical protein